MNIQLAKAEAVINDYLKTGNAYKTLIKHGYSETTAKKQSKQILDTCYKKVLKGRAESKELTNPKEIRNSLEILGVTEEMVKNKLKEIAFNDKDYTNALKVLTLLAKDINLNLVEDNTQKTPSVSITLQENEVIEVKDTTVEE